MKDDLIIPRWARINQEARERLNKLYFTPTRTPEDDLWMDHMCNAIDYREGCRRRHADNWRTRTTRFLLWIVERINS